MDSAIVMYLGDVRLTIALAGGVTVWLLAAHAFRLACYWCIAVGSVFGAVAASKIIYMGWGLQLTSVEFKAVSGHAAGAAAVLPIVLSVLATSDKRHNGSIALLAGWVLGVAVAFALVNNGEHTPAEAFAGWCIGALASGSTSKKLCATQIHPSTLRIGAVLVTTILLAACMQAVPLGWWMIKAALALSGQHRIHTWNE